MGHSPGIKADNLRLASSLVWSFSSTVRGTLGGLRFPPGHRPSRKMLMNVMRCGSSKNDFTVSRNFLS